MLNTTNVTKFFASVTDPRKKKAPKYPLVNIITMTICAVICGCNDFNAIEEFSKSKQNFFGKFLDLSQGIPSHDTFNDVLNRIHPKEFHDAFTAWVNEIKTQVEGVIAIDGKTLRGTGIKGWKNSALHLVNAWSCENKLCLGQLNVDSKTNEITAIPMLLKLLDIEGATVTIDAMGCQTKIANQIVKAKADYLFSLKGNKGELYDDVKLFLDSEYEAVKNIEQIHCDTHSDHGRIEQRNILINSDLDWLRERHPAWESIGTIAIIKSIREIGEKRTVERRYFISSHKDKSADYILNKIRSHWAIENSLHWQLDVSFDEDSMRLRSGHAGENLALINKVALNMLKNETSVKKGMKTKRLKAGWDDQYLLKLLNTTWATG